MKAAELISSAAFIIIGDKLGLHSFDLFELDRIRI